VEAALEVGYSQIHPNPKSAIFFKVGRRGLQRESRMSWEYRVPLKEVRVMGFQRILSLSLIRFLQRQGKNKSFYAKLETSGSKHFRV
jgi:hypothetical protein